MPDHVELRELLQKLQGQLSEAGSVDSEVRQLLAAAEADIHRALRSHPPTAAEPSLVDRLRTAAEHFEADHPALTSTLGGVIDALARLGI